VGCLGDRVDGFLAAVTAGQAVVAPLGLEDLGQAADVVLAGLAGVGVSRSTVPGQASIRMFIRKGTGSSAEKADLFT
jgi:hypothetical protein